MRSFVIRHSPLVILLLAACLRLPRLTHIGLEHDEVANWLIDKGIQAGNHGIYFQEAYGHEAGFHYVQTLFITLLGDNALALRLPAALLGIILVAVSHRLIKTLYNRQTATIAALILAITFFPTFYSRLALRAIMLPVLSGASAYFFWQALQHQHRRHTITAALLAGLSLYTYMAGRVVPIFYALYFGSLFLFSWGQARARLRGFLLFSLLGCVVIAPLLWYLASHPGAEARTAEIDAPLRALLAGDLTLVWANAKLIIGVFGWSGDPLWRQNVAFAPIFNPLTAILFYAGVALALWRHSKADMFALLWLATATIPSTVTVDAPSTIRMINMLPFLGLFPALAITSLLQKNAMLGRLLIAVCFIWGSTRTLTYTHRIWPNGGDVPFVWQTALTSAARYADTAAPYPTTFVGWTPATMDAPTIELALKNDQIGRRFTGADTLVLPASDHDNLVRIMRPTTPDLPLAPILERWLQTNGATTTAHPHFASYELRVPRDEWSGQPTLFGEQIAFLGHTDCATAACDLITIWQVTAPITRDLQIFVHVLDAAGNIISQSDGMSANEQFLQPGDLILQAHTVDLTGGAAVHTGIYEPHPPYPRLLTAAAADYFSLSLETR